MNVVQASYDGRSVASTRAAGGGWRALVQVILIVYLVETVLGGGGRLVPVGPGTLRMVIFGAVVAIAGVEVLYRGRVGAEAARWLSLAGLVVTLAAVVGLVREAPVALVLTDVSPLLTFLALPFIAGAVRSPGDVRLVSRVVRWSAVVLAVAAVAVFAMLRSGQLDWVWLYQTTDASAELFWRDPESFFYKGFLYLAVGIAFFVPLRGTARFAAIGLFTVAILLTETRGLFLAAAAAVVVYLSYVRRGWVVTVVQAVVVVGAVFVFADDYAALASEREASDVARIVQVSEVVEHATPASVLVGHGLGIGVPSRPVRMEVMFAEVVHKQGLVGLAFWAALLVRLVQLFRSARAAGYGREAAPFLLAAVVVYVQSLTNPFLNNPIGLTMVLVSLVCLDVLRRSPGPGRPAAVARVPAAVRAAAPPRRR